ncbi:MAG: hypothetical protein J4F34_07535 [Gemmatimonadetes bacterium]|nr:hypothetical protein [Gemmatimonadota bacterium]
MRTGTAMRAVGGFALALAAAAVAAASSGGCASCQLSRGGDPWVEMPDLDIQVGDTVVIDEVWRHFLPERCQGPGLDERFPDGFSTGPHAADSSDSAAVAVSFDDQGELLSIVALGVADSVRVRVWSTMGGAWDLGPSERNFHEFHVRVR